MSRVVKNTLKNIRRSPYQAIAAMMVLIISFFVAQTFALITYGSERVIGYFESQPQVTAFFSDEASESDIQAFQQQIANKPYVADVVLVSKEEALSIYQRQNADDPLLLEMVTADILPASLEVSTTKIEDLPLVKQDLENLPNVEEVVYQQDVIDAMRKWTSGLRFSGIVVVAFLAVTSLLVLIIITSMKVASKRKEIAILRLIGAGSWFIRGPFILEGAVYGLIAALVSWGAVYVALLYSTPVLIAFLGDIPVLPIDPTHMLMLLGGTSALGIVMGMFSGFVSSKRFYA